MINNEFSILGIVRSSNMYHTCIMFVLVLKKGGFSMDWIVWEMLEKLKADKDILTRMRDEAKAICLDITTVDMLYWKGLVAGYNTQIRWTQDNIDKLENMIREEQRNDEAYDEHMRQLRAIGRGGGYI